MFPDFDEFVRRADAVRAQIAVACARVGRDPAGVELLAVTKTHPALAADYAARYGLRAVGENRVQEGVQKRAEVAPASAGLRWELIGHLQSNKARLAARHFDRIQSVDSAKLLIHLERAAGELGKTLPILLQNNSGNDPAKFGADPAAAPRLLETALVQPHLRVEGLM
ncbi:MAG: YggS family pyridoxal phosphate-dependent enzyme, partial [Verrucomicrobia bacterium]|nr:YggS family pyridoxal phosphate-dependent enzyme [Verrucomicrobiota bacterium]